MKKQLVWFAAAIAVLVLAAFTKPVKQILHPEQAISKNISLAVFSNDNYKASIYAHASASLQVSIVKNRGGERKLVWQKNYDAKLLTQYPSLANALSEKVVVNNILDSKDKLEVIYTLTYKDNGNSLQLMDGTIITKGQKDGKLFINI